MKKYPTNITDNQWQFIKNTLELGDFLIKIPSTIAVKPRLLIQFLSVEQIRCVPLIVSFL
jgi:hypothetical protein